MEHIQKKKKKEKKERKKFDNRYPFEKKKMFSQLVCLNFDLAFEITNNIKFESARVFCL